MIVYLRYEGEYEFRDVAAVYYDLADAKRDLRENRAGTWDESENLVWFCPKHGLRQLAIEAFEVW